MPLSPTTTTTPWVVAHRGARDQAPENTLAAFERALAYPIDGIELDVQMSSDGALIIWHDATLQRLTGRPQRVADLSFSELKALDWGSWFDPAYAGEPSPTLDAVVASLGRRTRLMIEIKSYDHDRRSGRTRRVMERVIEVLDPHRTSLAPEQVYLLSFDPDILAQALVSAPQWRCVLNLPENEPNRVMAKFGGFAASLLNGLWALDAEIGGLTPPLVEWARSRCLRCLTYTCNDPEAADKAITLGVDAILSDRPGWLTRYLGRSSHPKRKPNGVPGTTIKENPRETAHDSEI